MGWGAAIGAIGAGLLGRSGASSANQANREMAQERMDFEDAQAGTTRRHLSNEAQLQRNFNAEEALANREWQERMSSTAVQRRMDDLKSAGINPLLAGQNSADTGSGSAATSGISSSAKANSAGYTAINEMSPAFDAMSSAMGLARTAAETDFTRNKSDAIEPVSGVGSWLGQAVDRVKDRAEKGTLFDVQNSLSPYSSGAKDLQRLRKKVINFASDAADKIKSGFKAETRALERQQPHQSQKLEDSGNKRPNVFWLSQ